MNRRQIIVDIRNTGRIKAMKPCFIYLKPNYGRIYKGRRADFIMSMRDDKLYFQKVSFLLHHLQPKGDFVLDLKKIISYSLVEGKLNNTLCLYSKEREFIEIYYDKLTSDTVMTQENALRIIKALEELGIKELKTGENDGE